MYNTHIVVVAPSYVSQCDGSAFAFIKMHLQSVYLWAAAV